MAGGDGPINRRPESDGTDHPAPIREERANALTHGVGAVVGVVFKLLATGRFPLVSTAIYVSMGWLVLVAVVPMVRRLDPWVIAWLVAGGVAYTAGTWFYHNRRLAFSHAVWHGFVLAGSVCHGVAVGLQI